MTNTPYRPTEPNAPNQPAQPHQTNPYRGPNPQNQAFAPTQTAPDHTEPGESGPYPTDRGQPIGQDKTKTADRDRMARETPVRNPEPKTVPEPVLTTRHGDPKPSSKK